jgi:hypothetical protein
MKDPLGWMRTEVQVVEHLKKEGEKRRKVPELDLQKKLQ